MSTDSVTTAPVTAQEATKFSSKNRPNNQQRNRNAFGAWGATLAQSVKGAAQFDLRALAEEAGFRPGHGKKFHCIGHEDRKASAHQYREHIHRFCCGDNLDAIDLAQIIINGSPGDAIRWLAARYGIAQEPGKRLAPRFSEANYANAELVRVGFCWAIDNELAELKRPLLESGFVNGEQIFRLTALLAQARRWSPRQATIFITKLRSRDSQRVQRWMQDVLDFQLAMATAIAYPSTGVAQAA